MKKICICTTISLTMKIFVLPTAKYLYEKCGYDVTLICDHDKEFESMIPEYIHYIPVKMNRGIDFSAINSIKEFARIFKKEKFDLVQYSTPNASFYASIAAYNCKVPIRLYCQWGIRYVGLSGINRKIFKMVEKIICKNSTVIRAQSKKNLQFSVDEGLYAKEKAGVVGNGGTIGVDSQIFDISQKDKWRNEIRTKLGIEEKFVFGFSGRITIDKGCRELFGAFKKIQEDLNCVLLIVGENEGIDKANIELMDWAMKTPNIIFTGAVKAQDMCKYYAAMDILVHPTYREGFGMVIQEAGAMGIPTITTDIPGASEVMQSGISSMHVAVKNVNELSKAMQFAKNNPEKIRTMGSKSYERFFQLYERKKMLNNQLEDYQNILEGIKNEV